MQRRFTANQAAAHDDDLPANRDALVKQRRAQHIVVAGNAEHIRRDGIGAHGANDGIHVQRVQEILCHSGVQLHRNAFEFQLMGLPFGKLVQEMLEILMGCELQGAAQGVAGLIQRHLMASFGTGDGRLHTARAASDDRHLVLAGGREHVLDLVFLPDHRINGAYDISGLHHLSLAGEAAQAPPDLVGAALPNLGGKHGVRHQRPAQGNQIRLTVFQNGFHLIRVAKGTDAGNGLLHSFLHSLRQIDVDAVGYKHARMHQDPGIEVFHDAGRDVVKIHIGLQQLADFHAFGKVIAVLRQLRAGDADLNETFRRALPNGLEHLNDEPAAVFPAAAVLVGAVIAQLGEELSQEPPVTAVNGQNVESCCCAVCGGAAVAADDVVHQLAVHTPNGLLALIIKDIAGSHRQNMTGQEQRIAALAAVPEFDGGVGAVFVNGVHKVKHGGNCRGIIQCDHGGVVRTGGAMGNRFAHVDDGGAAFGPQLIVGDVFRREYAPGTHLSQRGGGGDHSVFQRQIPQLKRGEQHIVFGHSDTPFRFFSIVTQIIPKMK